MPDKAELRKALEDALDGLEEMIGYASDYLQKKWDHQGYIDRARAALAAPDGDDESQYTRLGPAGDGGVTVCRAYLDDTDDKFIIAVRDGGRGALVPADVLEALVKAITVGGNGYWMTVLDDRVRELRAEELEE